MGDKIKTQNDLAEKLGCSQPFLSRWKDGKVGLRIETATAWGKILGVEPHLLLFAKPGDRPGLLGLE